MEPRRRTTGMRTRPRVQREDAGWTPIRVEHSQKNPLLGTEPSVWEVATASLMGDPFPGQVTPTSSQTPAPSHTPVPCEWPYRSMQRRQAEAERRRCKRAATMQVTAVHHLGSGAPHNTGIECHVAAVPKNPMCLPAGVAPPTLRVPETPFKPHTQNSLTGPIPGHSSRVVFR